MPFDPVSPPTTSPLSAAQVIPRIDGWHDLPLKRRRTMISAVRALQPALGLPLEAIIFEPAALTRALKTVTPAAMGVGPGSFATYRNAIRAVLRRLGLLPSGKPALTPLWQSQLDSVHDRFVRMRLRGFARFASGAGLTPAQIDSTTILAYGEVLRTRMYRHPDTHVRKVLKAWNAAADTVPGWPQTRLAAPAKCVRFTLPLSAYPASFQADVALFADRLSGRAQKGLFGGDAPPRALAPRSVELRCYNIRLAAAALVMQGREPASITCLADLVEEAAVRAILEFYYARAGERKTTHLGGIATALMIVARHHCRLPAERLTALDRLTRQARPPKRSEMTEKNANRLRPLDDRHIEAKLICLPQQLMREADRLRQARRMARAGWAAAAAVATQILLICPMRAENLAELRLDANLLRLGPKARRITHLVVPGSEVKNRQRIEWAVDAELAALLQTYIEEYRSLLPHHDNAWLFPHRDDADRHRDQVAMAQGISHAIRKHVGIEMHVHLFRAYAAKVLLEDNPGALDDLRLLLGHKGLETTLTYYVHFRGKAAAERFQRIVFGKRRQARLLAAGRPRRRGA
jgi:integrase